MKIVISGKIIDVFNRRIFKGEVVIENIIIFDIHESDIVDDVYILPGLTNSYVHIESSMLIPTDFSKMVVPRGTVSVVTDPHEIANVHGISGVEFMMNNAAKSPLKIFFGAPSCVPATSFETSGATIDYNGVVTLFEKGCIVLSEMMNFPGVIKGDEEVIKKIEVGNRLIDLKGGIALKNPSSIGFLELALPFSGLMTNRPGVEVANKYEELNKETKKMGCSFNAPFMTLAFMSLLVIPEIKLSDKGLFDVNTFHFISPFNN